METDKQKFKTVATYLERIQADMAVALLGDNGITAGVFGALSQYFDHLFQFGQHEESSLISSSTIAAASPTCRRQGLAA